MSAQQIKNNLKEIKRLAAESEELAKNLKPEVNGDWFPSNDRLYFIPGFKGRGGWEPQDFYNGNEDLTKTHKLLFGITKTKEEFKTESILKELIELKMKNENPAS